MITYHYDSLNRVVEIESASGIKQYEYDPVGNVTQMRDELGHVTHYEYSLTGKLTKVVDALGNNTEYTYDLLDQLIEVKQLDGIDGTDGIDVDLTTVNQHNEASRMTIYHRNILGQLERMTDALGQTETFKYSGRGELIEKVDKDGFLTEYSYTKTGDLSNIQYADGRSVEMSYNPLRQLTEIKDWLGLTQIDVDPLGRATKVIDHNDNVVEYSYGKLGERTGITYPDGREISYSYDENLRLTQVNDGNNPVNYHYDNLGRLTEKSFSNGTKTTYNFNDLGRLSSLTHFKQGEILDKYVYGYDILGNKTSIAKERQGLEVDNGAYTYSYDPLNRLTDVTKDGNPLRSYEYDSFGNQISMLENNVEIGYTYNSLNQLISSTDGKSFSYDRRGNLAQIMKNGSIINEYEFNPMNRLTKAINHETGLSSIYKYNGLNKRVGSIVGDLDLNPTKQIDHVLDLTKAYHNLLQRNEDGVTNSYTYDFGLLSAEGNLYLLDDLGSPMRFSDEVYGYDEFGNSLHEHTSSQPFGFTGYSHDEVAGNYFVQARQYEPTVGRFISEDLIKGFADCPQSLNQYTYCWNQPMDFVDLDGLQRGQSYRELREEFGDDWQTFYSSGIRLPSLPRNPNINEDATSRPFGPAPAPIPPPTLREKGTTVNAIVCSLSGEVEVGVGFEARKRLGSIQGEIGISASDRLNYNPSDGFEFNRNVRQIGAQIDHTTSGWGIGARGIYTDEDGGQLELGPRRNNSETDVLNDRVIGVGASLYFLLGGGFNIQLNLSEVLRRIDENENGLWQACD